MNERFIKYLLNLRAENPQLLAQFRTGAGREPKAVSVIVNQVNPYLYARYQTWTKHSHYVVAALLACHPSHKEGVSIGHALAKTRQTQDEETVDPYFTAFLNTCVDHLPKHLKKLITLLEAHKVPIDYGLLLSHLVNWEHETHWVQQTLARHFWGYSQRYIDEKIGGAELTETS